MSVPVKDRRESKLEVLVKAEELAAYTLHICSNSKNFDPAYAALSERICSLAVGIYEQLFMANCIRITDEETKAMRVSQQYQAIIECDIILADIQLCKPVFKISTKRLQYWGGLAIDTQRLARAWRESDVKRHLNSMT